MRSNAGCTLCLAVCIALSSAPTVSSADTQGDYYYTVSNGVASITGFNCYSTGALVITNNLGGYPVSSIGANAFAWCYGLTSVLIPSSVTTIGASAFSGCPDLTNITVEASSLYFSSVDGVLLDRNQTTLIQYPGGRIGDYVIPLGVTTIVNSAFAYCNGLTSITVSSGGTTIGESAFENCNSLTAVTILHGAFIGAYAFEGCDGLKSVSMSAGVSSIGDFSFRNCEGLTSVTISVGVTSIGESPFLYCVGLTNIEVEASNIFFSSVDGVLFDRSQTLLMEFPYGRTGDYVVPSSVVSIGPSAFRGCSELTSVTLPSGVTNIGASAFRCCWGLTSFTFPEKVTAIGDFAFEDCSGLTSISLPMGITSIGFAVFAQCTELKSILIPAGVRSIGASAFECCYSLTSVTIPASVTAVGNYAFAWCDGLSGVFFKGNIPTQGVSPLLEIQPTVYYLPGTSGWGSTFNGCPTKLWNPQILEDELFGVRGDCFGFNMRGTPDIPVVVEASSNLSSGVWTPLLTNTLGSAGSLHFSDSASANYPARFYRIVWP